MIAIVKKSSTNTSQIVDLKGGKGSKESQAEDLQERSFLQLQHKTRQSRKASTRHVAFVTLEWVACHVYDTFEKRLEKAKALKLCFNCLNTGHLTVRCPRDKFTCRNCEGPHNTDICNKIAAKNAEIASITTGMTIAQSKHVLEEGEALLMVIKGEVFNPLAPNSSADVWIFLDPGSTRPFISKRLSDELGLVTQNTDYLNLIGFNEPEGKMYETKRFDIRHQAQKWANNQYTSKLHTIDRAGFNYNLTFWKQSN